MEHCEYSRTEQIAKSQSGGWGVLVSLQCHLNARRHNKSSIFWGQTGFLEHVGQHDIDGLTFLSFRMSVSDFRQNFEVMEVCHQTEAFQSSSVQPWSCSMHHGTWVSSITAGGPPIGSKGPNNVAKTSVYEHHRFHILSTCEYSGCAN